MDFTQIIRDPIWQFVGVVLSAIAIFISIVLRPSAKDKKSLTLIMLANVPVFHSLQSIRDELIVTYKGTQARNLNFIQFVIRNSGQLPILPSDFIEPITVHLSESAKIIELEQISSTPANLGLEMTMVRTNQLEFNKTLLNPGDSFTGKVVAADNSNVFTPTARIVGVSAIKVDSYERAQQMRPYIAYIGFGGLAVFLSILGAALVWWLFEFNVLFGWLVSINMVTVVFIRTDKILATSQRNIRIPERIILLLALLGGSIGALIGIYLLSHKTAKPRFILQLVLILFIQIVLLYLYQFYS